MLLSRLCLLIILTWVFAMFKIIEYIEYGLVLQFLFTPPQ